MSFRAQVHLRAPRTSLTTPTSAQVQPPGSVRWPPRCPHSPSLLAPAEGFDQRQQAGTLLQAPGPILQCQLIDLQMSGESTEKHMGCKGRSITSGTGCGETRPPEGLALLPGYRHAPLLHTSCLLAVPGQCSEP